MDRVQQKKPLSLTKEHGMVTAFQVKILNPHPRAESKYLPQKHILLASFFMISEFMPHNESKSQNMRPICIYTSVLLLVKIVAQHNFEQQRHLLDLFAICSTHCIRYLTRLTFSCKSYSNLILTSTLFDPIPRCLNPALQIFSGQGFPPAALPSSSSAGRCPSSGPSRWPAGSQKSPPHLFVPCCQVPPSNPWVLSLQVLQGVQLPLFYKHSTGLSHPAIWKL